jgi:hypothetical protein
MGNMRAEVRLKVPNMKEPVKDPAGYPINHADLRFRKTIEIPTRPREGEALELTTQSGLALPATIVRVEIDEPRALFVLSCRFARRAITPVEYQALATDPAWELKHLLDG